MNNAVFWEKTPHLLKDVYRRFEEMYWLNIHEQKVTQTGNRQISTACFLQFPCLVYSSARKMEAVCIFEMLANFYRTTRRHIPNYSTHNTLMVFENAGLKEYSYIWYKQSRIMMKLRDEKFHNLYCTPFLNRWIKNNGYKDAACSTNGGDKKEYAKFCSETPKTKTQFEGSSAKMRFYLRAYWE
jgi:hypothetical protein